MNSQHPVASCKGRFTAPPNHVPTDHVVDGPLLGNGDVGVVLSGPPEALCFHIGKNDCWTRDTRNIHSGPTILTVGGLGLSVPALAGGSYAVEQDIEKAEIRGRFATEQATLELTSWMSRQENLLVCEFRNPGANPLELTSHLWAGDPQIGFVDHAGQATLVGHTACWLTPCIDRFCGEIASSRVDVTALTAEEAAAICAGAGPVPWHVFTALKLDTDPLSLARELPLISGGSLTLSVCIRRSSDRELRATRKAAQPHGFTLHMGADVQFLMAKPGVFNLRLVDDCPAMTVGRLSAAAQHRIVPDTWTWITAVFDGRKFTFYIDGQIVPTVMPDRVTTGTAKDELWLCREVDPDLPAGLAVAMAATCQGVESRIVDGGLAMRLMPGQSSQLLVALVSSRDKAEPLAAARQLVTTTSTPDQLAAWRAAQTAWWREYWDRSLIDVGEPLIHQYYYGAYYNLACCCGDQSKVPPGLFGNWITTDTPAWRGDFHLNYNYQAPWWGAFSGNRVELAAAYDQPLLDYLPQARAFAQSNGWPGVLYPVGIGPWGISSDINFWGQKSNAAYAAVNMIMRWQATQDREYLQQTAYSFVREVGEFWESFLSFEEGRYVIRGDSIHEGSGQDFNSLLSLGLIRLVFEFLVETSVILEGDGDKRRLWLTLLEHASDFPTQERQGRRVFRLTERGMAWADGNSLALQHVFPTGNIGLGSSPELLEIARETVRQMGVWDDFNAFPSFYTQAARVGYDPDIILEKLIGQLRSPHALPNLYLSYGGGGIETCGGITSAINEMLVQGHDGVIRLFPSWPRHRDARFENLRVRGAFLVSATLHGGIISRVTIRSEAGGPCRLANPFAVGAIVSVHEASTGMAEWGPAAAGAVQKWDSLRGGIYLIENKAKSACDDRHACNNHE